MGTSWLLEGLKVSPRSALLLQFVMIDGGRLGGPVKDYCLELNTNLAKTLPKSMLTFQRLYDDLLFRYSS